MGINKQCNRISTITFSQYSAKVTATTTRTYSSLHLSFAPMLFDIAQQTQDRTFIVKWILLLLCLFGCDETRYVVRVLWLVMRKMHQPIYRVRVQLWISCPNPPIHKQRGLFLMVAEEKVLMKCITAQWKRMCVCMILFWRSKAKNTFRIIIQRFVYDWLY